MQLVPIRSEDRWSYLVHAPSAAAAALVELLISHLRRQGLPFQVPPAVAPGEPVLHIGPLEAEEAVALESRWRGYVSGGP